LPTLAWGWPGGIYGTGIAMVMNRAPQIVELIRDPDVSGVSTTTWTMIATGGVCWMVFYENARLWAAFASTSCACVASITIALLALWRHSNAGASRSAQQSVLTQF
jgi:catabolite regulation protein CreA